MARPTLTINIQDLQAVKERKLLILKVLDNQTDYPELTETNVKDLALEYIEITRQQQVEYSRRSNTKLNKVKNVKTKAKVDLSALLGPKKSQSFDPTSITRG